MTARQLPQDPFKSNRLIQTVAKSVTEKPGTGQEMQYRFVQEPYKDPRNSQKRWTEKEILCQRMEHVFNGKGPGQHELNSESYPLPSCVNKDGVFRDFPTGKGLNLWEKKYRVTDRHLKALDSMMRSHRSGSTNDKSVIKGTSQENVSVLNKTEDNIRPNTVLNDESSNLYQTATMFQRVKTSQKNYRRKSSVESRERSMSTRPTTVAN